jgi:hypothetical protein
VRLTWPDALRVALIACCLLLTRNYRGLEPWDYGLAAVFVGMVLVEVAFRALGPR